MLALNVGHEKPAFSSFKRLVKPTIAWREPRRDIADTVIPNAEAPIATIQARGVAGLPLKINRALYDIGQPINTAAPTSRQFGTVCSVGKSWHALAAMFEGMISR
ncbi:MAG TPA: hypothetical protein VII92_13985 [Anaerolineae bacterium]